MDVGRLIAHGVRLLYEVRAVAGFEPAHPFGYVLWFTGPAGLTRVNYRVPTTTHRPFPVYSPSAFVISSSDMTAAEGVAGGAACSGVAFAFGLPLRLGTGSAAFSGAARV